MLVYMIAIFRNQFLCAMYKVTLDRSGSCLGLSVAPLNLLSPPSVRLIARSASNRPRSLVCNMNLAALIANAGVFSSARKSVILRSPLQSSVFRRPA
jgi:hypothetical protein